MAGIEKQGGNSSGWLILAILSCLGLIVMFDETMILPAIPDFIRDFNISYSASSWLLSAYIIAAAVMTPIGGRLSDIYGKKKILLIVMGIYLLGVIGGRFATGMETMLAARAAQGVGMAMFPIAFGIIREVLPEKRLAIGQTIFSSTFSGGAVVGLVGGAALIQNFGWQSTFVAILPFAIGLWLAIVKFVRVPAPVPYPGMEAAGPPDRSIDLKGTLTLTATIITFLAGITFLESRSAGAEYMTAGLFAASGVSLVGFIAIEKRVRMPLLDFKLMTSKSFLPPTLILLLTFMSIFMVYLTMPIMVRSPEPLGFGGDVLAVASVQLPFMLVLLAGTVLSGFMLSRIKNTRLTLAGTIISAAGFFILLMFHSTESEVSFGLTILAAGLALSIAGAFNVILVSVPMQMTGIALGMTLLLNLVGMSVGPALSGILQETYQGTVPGVAGTFPAEAAYNLIFVTSAAVSLASVGMALFVAGRKAAPAITTPDPREAGKGSA
ncbi:MFS transporter [Nitrososphaera sp.]|uniref:MFS transporter n=1 Tax=Nitrososphaera sp. TaxID=1971748 RepID=UPI00317762B1